MIRRGSKSAFQAGLALTGIALAIGSLWGAEVSGRTFERPYLIGRIDPDRYHMWDDISHNTHYSDVVFSPVLESNLISAEIGVSNKIISPAKNFSDVDQKVDHVCGNFNVVVALPPGTGAGEFASRDPSEVIETRNIRLLRFADYAGKAIGCSK